jgi:hypothetical protein
VPPLKVAERKDVCPWSMVGEVPDGVLTTRAGLTVTRSEEDAVVDGVAAESVTVTQ